MKTKTAPILSCFILVYVLFLLPTFLHAQPGFGDDVQDVPIDGGMSLLAAAGIGYGVKKLKQRRNTRKSGI